MNKSTIENTYQITKSISSKIKILPINPDEDLIDDNINDINGNINDNINDNINGNINGNAKYNTFVIKSNKWSGSRYIKQDNHYRFIRNGERVINENIKYVHIGNITSRLVIDNKSIFHYNIRSIIFGPKFNSELMDNNIMVLPQTLKHLYLGSEYDKPFIINNKRVLPKRLKTLNIGYKYSLPFIIDGMRCIPKFLSRIHLTDCRTNIQYVINGKSIFPKRIRSIHFPNNFNEYLIIGGVKIIPEHTQCVKLGNAYNKPFIINDIHVLPNNLETLFVGNEYDQPIIIKNKSVFNSRKLRRLIFGEEYNQPIKIGDIKGIPDWVEHINLGVSFCQPIAENMFPTNMKNILFGSAIEKKEFCREFISSHMTDQMITQYNKENNKENNKVLPLDIFNDRIEYIELPMGDDFVIPILNFSSSTMREKQIKIIMRYTQYVKCLEYDPNIFLNKDIIVVICTQMHYRNQDHLLDYSNNIVAQFWDRYIVKHVLLRKIKYSSLKIMLSSFKIRNTIGIDYTYDLTPKLKICEEIIEHLPMPITEEIHPEIDTSIVPLKK